MLRSFTRTLRRLIPDVLPGSLLRVPDLLALLLRGELLHTRVDPLLTLLLLPPAGCSLRLRLTILLGLALAGRIALTGPLLRLRVAVPV